MAERFWSGRRVFVTGATGLMGGWLVKRLLAEGADVVALVRDRVPRTMFMTEGLGDRVTIVQGCVEDLALLRRALSEYAINTVFHLAAQPLVGVAMANPVGTLEANVRGTWNVLETARQAHVAETVVASSDKAYGVSEELPYFETHPLKGIFPYDVSKSCADLISTMYARTYGLPVTVMRCANLFGGGDLNFNRTIPGAIQATLLGQQFRIRSDGTCIRDFLYVKDAALAYLTAAEGLARHPELAGEAFNFSMAMKLSVLDVTGMILRLMHREDLEPIIENRARAEVQEQYMTCTKARQVFGWEPEYVMEQALLETIDWYASYFGVAVDRPAARGAVAAAYGPDWRRNEGA
jgi:CDP-glucose 4,6-dehydratase